MSTLKFNSSQNTLIVEAIIKARITAIARLAVDTGASLVVLPWKLISAVGIHIDQKNLVETTTASMVESVPQVIIPELIVLRHKIKNVSAIVKDLPPESPVEGLLGLSFLKNFRLDIDFRKGILYLT